MNIVLVEDHVLFRDSLRIALGLEKIGVAGQASTAREAYGVVAAARPDVLVVDMMLPDTDGVSVVRELRRRRISVPVLVMTRIVHPTFVRDAFSAGALGYASKDDSLAEIAGAIRVVARRERYVSPVVREALDSSDADGAVALDALSVREREVFCRIVEGLTAKEIARALCVSPKTVYTHRLQINRKLGVHSPAQLARLAARQGLV